MDKKVVEYESDRCGHVNSVEFIGDIEPFESKTRGCGVCGMTSEFKKMNVKHKDSSDLNPDDSGENSNETTTTNTDVENEDDEESDHQSIRTHLHDLSYRELQSIASETDTVAGNLGEDDMIEELASLETDVLTDAIETGLEDE